jgi:membrane protease YdiL (CAAX protease family)
MYDGMVFVLKFLHIQYIIALVAGPLFVMGYNIFQGVQNVDIYHQFTDYTSLFFLLLFYPGLEELIFRGMIQEIVAVKVGNHLVLKHLSVANIVTSLLFVAMHFVYHTPLWALLVFVPSLIFGYFKEQYKYIAPSIFLHMFYNFCSLFLL